MAAAIGTVVALAVIVIPSHLGVRPDLLPRSSTSWYYLHLAQATADLGAFPASVAEWGALRPFPTDYLPVTAHTAAALLLLPGDQLVRLEIYRLLILGLGVLFATVLFRRWVSRPYALAGAILLLGTVRLDQKFDGYRPETVAFVLALFVLWVADRAFVERDRRLVALAVVGAAVVFLSHAEVFLILAAALVGIGIGRALIAPGGRRPGGRVAMADAPRACCAGACDRDRRRWPGPGCGRGLAADRRGASRSATSSVATPRRRRGADAGRPGEIPAGWTFTDDPTWDFYTASVAPGLDGTQPPDAFTDSLLLPRSILLVWPGLDGRTRSGLVVLAALVVAPFLAWPFLDPRRRRFLLGWALFAVVLVAGSLVLFELSNTYVPQRTAGRRLMPYLLIVPVVAMTAVLWLLGRLDRAGMAGAPAGRWPEAGGRRCARAGRPDHRGRLGLAARAGAADEREAALSPAGYAAYRWMATELPADARILANAYTDGAIVAVSGRTGIVDGRAVYLEDPGFLAESTALVLGARVVFGTPSAPGAGDVPRARARDRTSSSPPTPPMGRSRRLPAVRNRCRGDPAPTRGSVSCASSMAAGCCCSRSSVASATGDAQARGVASFYGALWSEARGGRRQPGDRYRDRDGRRLVRRPVGGRHRRSGVHGLGRRGRRAGARGTQVGARRVRGDFGLLRAGHRRPDPRSSRAWCCPRPGGRPSRSPPIASAGGPAWRSGSRSCSRSGRCSASCTPSACSTMSSRARHQPNQ